MTTDFLVVMNGRPNLLIFAWMNSKHCQMNNQLLVAGDEVVLIDRSGFNVNSQLYILQRFKILTGEFDSIMTQTEAPRKGPHPLGTKVKIFHPQLKTPVDMFSYRLIKVSE